MNKSLPDFTYSKVSVIIPAYNSARFLSEAIESVLGQSYPVFEVIVVDDGSTDKTKEICSKYPNIKYIYQSNQGVSAARNLGVQISQGAYLLFLDSDDRLLPKAIEIGVNCIKERPEVGFVFGNYIFQSINPDGSYKTEEIYDYQPEVASYATLLAADHRLQCACILFRRISVVSVGGFDTSLKANEDVNLFLKVARAFPVFFHNQTVSEYRYNGANVSRKPIEMLIGAVNSHRLQWNYIKQTGNKEFEAAYERGRQFWIKLFVERLPYEIMRYVQTGNWISALSTLRLILNYDPQLKYVDKTVYESSRKAVLSELRELSIQPSLAYWKQQLWGIPPLLPLPTDRMRGVEQNLRGCTQSFIIPQDLTESIKSLSSLKGVTLYTTLLAAFNILIYRYTDTNDIVVGSPISSHDDLSVSFVNAVVLRTNMSGNPSFQKLLSQVKKIVSAAIVHQDVPFEILVEELLPQRELSYSPLFQVMFVLEEDTSLQNVDLSNLTASPWVLENNEGKFDLVLFLKQDGKEIQGKWIYNADLFDAETIDRLKGHFQILLEGIVANPEQSISELPLLTEKEERQLLVDWNNIQTEYPQNGCIHHWFEKQVETTPDRVAVTYKDQQLSYRELNNQANQLANHLIVLGVRPDTLVGICVERSLEMIVGILGILKAGGAYVPLDPNTPRDRLDHILSDARVTILLTQSTLLNDLPACEQNICLDSDNHIFSQYSQSNPSSNADSDNLAYIIYTSGSTGKPKGVLVSHNNVIRLFTSTEPWYNFHSGDVWTLFHSFAFDFSVWEIWGALFYGGRIIIVPYLVCRDTKEFHKLLISEKVTILNQTPSAFYQLIEVDKCSNSLEELSLRLVIFGGEALNLSNLKPWFELHGDRFPQLVNMYGITETTVHVTYRPLTIADVKATGSLIGRPIPDLQIYLLDRYQQPVPIGVCGEIYVGGAGVGKGYWQRDSLTQERFISNKFSKDPNGRLYKSGDLARYLNDGSLEYLGRIDDQVKIRGFRIELGEIESVLCQHPIVDRVVVIARENAQGDKNLVAYITRNSEESPQVSEFRQFLQDKLPYYMVPSFFVVLNKLPLTSNGKVDRKALPAPTIESSPLIIDPFKPQDENQKNLAIRPTTSITSNPKQSEPRNSREKILVDIWEKILGLDNIGIHDNFFLLGGHSLSSVRLVAEIEKNFNCKFPLSSFFEIGTIAEISQWISEQPSEATPVEDLVKGVSLEDYRALLSLSAGMRGSRIGKRGLIINVLPESQTKEQPFIWIGEVKTGKKLNLNQPLHVMPGASLSPSMNSHKDYVSAIASLLVDELLSLQPYESYSLGGWCYNGLVALEMAQQLNKLGKKVNLLVLVDVSTRAKLYRSFHALNLKLGTLRFHLSRISKLSLKEKWQYIVLRMVNKGGDSQYVEVAEEPADLELGIEALTKAFKNYIPDAYRGRVLLIVGTEQIVHGQKDIKYFDLSWLFPYKGWEKLLKGKVYLSKIECDHLELMDEPYCKLVGEIIQNTVNLP